MLEKRRNIMRLLFWCFRGDLGVDKTANKLVLLLPKVFAFLDSFLVFLILSPKPKAFELLMVFLDRDFLQLS